MNHFYVYCLFRPTGEPFYVGKGSADRMNDHSRDGNKQNPHKCNIIKKARREGLQIEAKKIADQLIESHAFELERFLILELGRTPRGPLVNLTDGGEGPWGLKRTESNKAAISKALRGVKKSEGHRAKCAINAAKAGAAAAAMPDEFRRARYLKAFFKTTHEKRSEWQKKAWATRYANDPFALERIRELGRLTGPNGIKKAIEAAAARPPEERSETVRLANASRTPEERSEIARKSWVTRRARNK